MNFRQLRIIRNKEKHDKGHDNQGSSLKNRIIFNVGALHSVWAHAAEMKDGKKEGPPLPGNGDLRPPIGEQSSTVNQADLIPLYIRPPTHSEIYILPAHVKCSPT